MARGSITRRLTRTYAVVMAVVLLASSGAIYVGVRFSQDRTLRRDLDRQRSELVTLVERGDDLGGALAEHPDSYAQVLDARGDVLASTTRAGRAPLLDAAERRDARTGSQVFDHGSLAKPRTGALRVATKALTRDGERVVAVVAVPRGARDEALRELVGQLLGVGAASLLVTVLVGYRFTRAALGPVERLREQAADLYRRAEGGRLAAGGSGDELDRLAATLNEMLERIDVLVEQERTFAADASHELRTPLTIIIARADLALRRTRSVDELRAAIGSIQVEAERLTEVVEALLLLARTSSSALPPATEPLDVGQLARAAVARREGAFDGVIELQVADDLAPAAVHAVVLERTLDNLLDNAIRHARERVTVSLGREDDELVLDVGDDGPGFDAALLPRAFDRFARGRSESASSGVGLGLAIVAAAVRAGHGTVEAGSSPLGGARVVVRLPAPCS